MLAVAGVGELRHRAYCLSIPEWMLELVCLSLWVRSSIRDSLCHFALASEWHNSGNDAVIAAGPITGWDGLIYRLLAPIWSLGMESIGFGHVFVSYRYQCQSQVL